MTDESQKFHVVWIMPGGREMTDSTIHESHENAQTWADDRISKGFAQSRQFRVAEWTPKKVRDLSKSWNATRESDIHVRKAAQEAYDVAVVREFLDYVWSQNQLKLIAFEETEVLLKSWLESRSTANQKGPENVS